MRKFVALQLKRNRGWPYPEDSFGLTPMFGEEGWCHSCGVPKGPQAGSIVLQRKGIKVEGAWVPNWRFDVICAEQSVGEDAKRLFGVELRNVKWHASSPGDAVQIPIPTVGDSWFDHSELHEKAVELHGVAGATCGDCGVWRWMPLPLDELPSFRVVPTVYNKAIIASPEWFGDGWKAYREVLIQRELAELLVTASPRDFRIHEIP